MHFFIIVAALVVTTTADSSPRDGLKPFTPDCIEETGASQQTVIKIINDDLEGLDSKGKCFMKCLCPKIKICDDEYKVDPKNLLKKVNVESAEKVFAAAEVCNELDGEDDCDTVYKRFKCMIENAPELKNPKK